MRGGLGGGGGVAELSRCQGALVSDGLVEGLGRWWGSELG